jgi:hypothetical protein
MHQEMEYATSFPVFQSNYKNTQKYTNLSSVLDLAKFWGMSNEYSIDFARIITYLWR